MFFKQIQNKMFPSGFFISDNRIFAIGIVGMTIQVLSKVNVYWTIIKEYKVVDENMKREWLAKILKTLEPITIKDSEAMRKILSDKKEKKHYINYETKKVTAGTIIPDSKITPNLMDVGPKKFTAGTIIPDNKSKDKKYKQYEHGQKSIEGNKTKSEKKEWKQEGRGF